MRTTPRYAELHYELRALGYTNSQIASVVNSPAIRTWIEKQLGPPVEVPPKVKPLPQPSPGNPSIFDALEVAVAMPLRKLGIHKLRDLESRTAKGLEDLGISDIAIRKIRHALEARGRHLEGEY